ncbi:myeloid leukemia factor 1 [Rhinoraja longicauda]
MFREMEDDPFFADPFHSHQENLRQLMSSFPVQLDQDLLVNSPNGKKSTQPCPKPKCPKEASKQPVASCSGDPFNQMMEQMRQEMLDMQRNIKHGSCNTDDHTLNTSTVMSYAKVGNEPPKVFQASTHVHHVPGGIKETRRAVKDSESGIDKLSIGHHIKDRGHVIQKCKNQLTGDEEVDQEFINLNEDDAQLFDCEWQEKVSKYLPPGTQTLGLQDVKKAMEGRRSKHGKRQSVSQVAASPSSCSCPHRNSLTANMKSTSKNGRR